MQNTFPKKIESYLKKYHMIEEGDHVVAAVSGGADSVCMLLVLWKLAEILGYTLSAVHVEHGIRGQDSLKDAAFVEELCWEHGIACSCHHFKVPEYAAANGLGEEEAGRRLRYEVFYQEREKYLAKKKDRSVKIAVAHNLEDNAETMLFHMARGTLLRGMAGIAPVREAVIRPLLGTSRMEIEAFLSAIGQTFCTDYTNAEDLYDRNRLRHQVMPVLQQVNAGAAKHMYQTAEYLRKVDDYLEAEAQKAQNACTHRTKAGVEVSKQDFMKLEDILKGKVLYKLLEMQAGSSRDISQVHISQLQELFEKQTGKRLSLPYGLVAVRTYTGIELYHSGEQEKGLQNQRFSWRIIEKKGSFFNFSKKKYTKCFDYDKIGSDFCIRRRQPGDFIVIDAAGARQKLKKYLINEKIPAQEREQLLLLADGSHIMWVVGYRISSYYKVGESTTKILEVTFYGGKENE